MSTLISRPADPRDQRWEVWDPTYRVCFSTRVSPVGWKSREFEVSDGDIVEVLDWAEWDADDGEIFTVFAIVGDGDRFGVVRLAGEDPTRSRDT